MKNTLQIILGLSETNGDYGVEIEAEGTNLPTQLKPSLWRVENDDSLKAGYEAREYVMREPLPIEGVKKSLDYLEGMYRENSTTVYDTQTSGVHVHINVQQYTPKELFTFLAAYYVLEVPLLTYCGINREGNHFCLRGVDSEWSLHELVKAATTHKFNCLNTENLRYSAMNPLSLFKYGSLESRAMRGTQNLDAIYEWVEILHTLRLNALQFSTPVDVVEAVRQGPVEFTKRMLGDKAKLFTNLPNLNETVKQGLRLILPLAFTVDWSTYKDVNKNPFAKGI